MEDEIEESKLETLSNIIKRKDSRIKMLSKISRNSTLIRLNLLDSAQLDKSTSNFQMKSEEFVSDLIDLLINSVIKVEPPAPTPQATHDETPSVEEVCENFGLNDVNLNYSDANYQNFAQFVSDFEINNDIKVEPPAPTPQATHDETPLDEEVCENFGLNDVKLNYSDADYQNFAQFVSDFEINNDIKVEPPAPTPKATNDESEIRSDSQINNYIKTLLLSLLKTELAEESEEKKCLPVPEMTVDSTPRYLTRLEIRKRLAHEKGHKC